jgi:hypothetical protein
MLVFGYSFSIVARFPGFTNPTSAFEHIKAGSGVVVNNTYIVVATSAADMAVAWALHGTPGFALGAMGIITAAGLIAMFGNWWLAHTHPDQAMTGGAQFARLRELQISARDFPELPVANNSNPPPIIDVTDQ